jgi:hypothetical protein
MNDGCVEANGFIVYTGPNHFDIVIMKADGREVRYRFPLSLASTACGVFKRSAVELAPLAARAHVDEMALKIRGKAESASK